MCATVLRTVRAAAAGTACPPTPLRTLLLNDSLIDSLGVNLKALATPACA